MTDYYVLRARTDIRSGEVIDHRESPYISTSRMMIQHGHKWKKLGEHHR